MSADSVATTLPKKWAPIMGPAPHSEPWYALRVYDPDRKGREVVIGASEAAAACNLSPYSSALQLFLEKRGQLPAWQPDPEAKERMEFGLRVESLVLDAYAEREDCEIEKQLPMFFHPEHAFCTATPDGIAHRSLENQWCVDAKNSNWRMFDESGESEHRYGQAGTDQVPVTHLCQAQQQMAVMGLDRCDFPVLKDGNKLLIYTVQRNDDLIAQIIAAERELYERILRNDPPEPNFEHTGTVKVLSQMFGCKVGQVASLTEAESDLWRKYEQLGITAKEANEEREEIKAKLLWSLGEAEVGRFPDVAMELKRTVVSDSYVTQKDVEELVAKVGHLGRKGHIRLTARKVK